MQTDVEKKNTAIEGLRGVAALLVVFNHLPFAAGALGSDRTAQFGFSPWEITTAARMGEFGVQLFFCITGYLFWQKLVLSGKPTDWVAFYRNRILRLVPAFAVSAIAVMICGFKLAGWHATVSPDIVAHDIFAMLSFGLLQQSTFNGVDISSFNAITWTLAYEWKLYVLLPLAVALNRERWLRWAGIAALFGFVLIYNQKWSLVLFFFSGALVASWKFEGSRAPIVGTLAFVAMVLVCLSIPHDMVMPAMLKLTGSFILSGGSNVLFLWAITSMAFVVAVKSYPVLLTNRAMIALGTVSYSMYLLHLIVLQVSIRAFAKFIPLDSWTSGTFLWWAVVSLVAIFIVSAISYGLVEKPFLRRKRPERPSSTSLGGSPKPELRHEVRSSEMSG